MKLEIISKTNETLGIAKSVMTKDIKDLSLAPVVGDLLPFHTGVDATVTLKVTQRELYYDGNETYVVVTAEYYFPWLDKFRSLIRAIDNINSEDAFDIAKTFLRSYEVDSPTAERAIAYLMTYSDGGDTLTLTYYLKNYLSSLNGNKSL